MMFESVWPLQLQNQKTYEEVKHDFTLSCVVPMAYIIAHIIYHGAAYYLSVHNPKVSMFSTLLNVTVHAMMALYTVTLAAVIHIIAAEIPHHCADYFHQDACTNWKDYNEYIATDMSLVGLTLFLVAVAFLAKFWLKLRRLGPQSTIYLALWTLLSLIAIQLAMFLLYPLYAPRTFSGGPTKRGKIANDCFRAGLWGVGIYVIGVSEHLSRHSRQDVDDCYLAPLAFSIVSSGVRFGWR